MKRFYSNFCQLIRNMQSSDDDVDQTEKEGEKKGQITIKYLRIRQKKKKHISISFHSSMSHPIHKNSIDVTNHIYGNTEPMLT